MNIYKKKELGNFGEQIAVDYLEKNSYKILCRNFYFKHDEIDIIAKDKSEIVFVEVKTRTSTRFGNPVDSVNRIKQKNMYTTAKYFLCKYNLQKCLIRFDVIEVLLKNGKFNVNHIKQIM